MARADFHLISRAIRDTIRDKADERISKSGAFHLRGRASVGKEKRRRIYHCCPVISTSCPDQTSRFASRVRSFPENGFLFCSAGFKNTRSHHQLCPPVPALVFTRWTHARENERGTRDSSGFRLSSITRLDVSLPY